ncbi:lipid kinase, YegS/Rv2252/BmrU family [Ligilactobacillus sp. WC1T17]|uniref:Lipid kinase, YegS/Rv2252/BmrU family n=1 Tax=Ligilactobacillus ruminis TaxID=1623 RepID=A0ABY1AAX7_9LACO|nr:lipid kinase, YegS/Rv2252/BmrU family [Ligilactobacillus ruminis]
MKTFFIIVNDQAANGKSVSTWTEIRQRLDQRHIAYSFHKTKKTGHARKLTSRYLAKLNEPEAKETVVMVVGGNGTLTEVLNGIKDTPYDQTPLAFIPTGETNAFAQGIGIATNPLDALDQVLSATEPVYYDIGEYHELTHDDHGFFVNDFGIGLDAFIVSLDAQAHKHKRLQRWLNKMHLKFLAYLVCVFDALLNQEAFATTLRIADKYYFYKKVAFINVANHPIFDNGIVLNPTANAKDHQLDLLIAENLNFFKFLLLVILMYFNKQLKLPYLHHYKSSEIHLIVNSLEFGQIDGEEIGNKYFDIFFNVTQYPFWMNISGIELEKRKPAK